MLLYQGCCICVSLYAQGTQGPQGNSKHNSNTTRPELPPSDNDNIQDDMTTTRHDETRHGDDQTTPPARLRERGRKRPNTRRKTHPTSTSIARGVLGQLPGEAPKGGTRLAPRRRYSRHSVSEYNQASRFLTPMIGLYHTATPYVVSDGDPSINKHGAG